MSLVLKLISSSHRRNGDKVADLIIEGINATIADKTVTYDFVRLMDGVNEVKCSEFAVAIAKKLVSNE